MGKAGRLAPFEGRRAVPGDHEAILAGNRLDQALWESWGSAGFNPAGIRPHPLRPSRRGSFLAHEIVRPIFADVCRSRRDWVPRLQVGWAGNATGPKILRAERAQEARLWELAVRLYREASPTCQTRLRCGSNTATP